LGVGTLEVNWKDVGVPLITAGLTILFGSTAVITYVVAAYLIPNVNVNISSDPDNIHSAYISVKNDGKVSATQLTLTIHNPARLLNHSIFSTENYVENKNYTTAHPNVLKIFVPRFVQGEGSLISVNLNLDPKAEFNSGQYVVYTTFDQGSVKKTLSVKTINANDTLVTSAYAFNSPWPPELIIPIFFGIVAVTTMIVGIMIHGRMKRKVPS
jgi:hypothetical protein